MQPFSTLCCVTSRSLKNDYPIFSFVAAVTTVSHEAWVLAGPKITARQKMPENEMMIEESVCEFCGCGQNHVMMMYTGFLSHFNHFGNMFGSSSFSAPSLNMLPVFESNVAYFFET